MWSTCIDLDGHSAPAVPWTPAAPAEDRPELRRWRAAVGAGQGGQRAGGHAELASHGRRVERTGWRGAIRSLWAQLAREHGPVILLLQEVFATGPHLPEAGPSAAWAPRITGEPDNEDRTDIVSFAREAGLSLLYVPSMRNGGPDGGPPEDRGNALLANVPLSSPARSSSPSSGSDAWPWRLP